jgi:hypothetical protein
MFAPSTDAVAHRKNSRLACVSLIWKRA